MLMKVSENQKSFIRKSIKQNLRLDGRANDEKRRASITDGVLAHLLGSSYLTLEEQNAEVYAGVKVQVEESESCLKPSIKLSFSSMKKTSQEQTQEIQFLQQLLEKFSISVLLSDKRVEECLKIQDANHHKLTLHIEVFLLSPPLVSMIPHILHSIRVALKTCSIPEFNVSFNAVTQQQHLQMKQQGRQIILPPYDLLVVGVSFFNSMEVLSADLTREEYESVDACVLVCILDGQVIGFEFLKGKIGVKVINQVVKFALVVSNQE